MTLETKNSPLKKFAILRLIQAELISEIFKFRSRAGVYNFARNKEMMQNDLVLNQAK